MPRLIDADELLRRYDEEHEGEPGRARKLIEEAPTVGGWISVQERLPESSGIKVIVSAKTTPESVIQTKAVFIAFLGYGDGKWYTPDVDFMASAKTGNDNIHPVWEITHWMFLPEPQKDGDHDV